MITENCMTFDDDPALQEKMEDPKWPAPRLLLRADDDGVGEDHESWK